MLTVRSKYAVTVRVWSAALEGEEVGREEQQPRRDGEQLAGCESVHHFGRLPGLNSSGLAMLARLGTKASNQGPVPMMLIRIEA